jgi:hypothetical protein
MVHRERLDRIRSIHDRALAIVDDRLRTEPTLADALAVLKALPFTIEPPPSALTAMNFLDGDLSRAEEAVTSAEVPNHDEMATLLGELSGDNVRRRKSRALRRVGVAAGVVDCAGD